MVNNKRGWIKIFEASLAILILSGVLLVVYSQKSTAVEEGTYIYNIQRQILNEISSREEFRKGILEENADIIKQIKDFVSSKIPINLGHSLKICNLEEKTCYLNENEVRASLNKELFVEETILSANLQTYKPKKVRLFVWENQ